MRSRALYLAVMVTAMVLAIGYAALWLGAAEAAGNIDNYRSSQGLPPRSTPDRWTLLVVGYAGGVALAVLVIVLMERWWSTGRERLRRALFLALAAGVAAGLALAVDGLLNLRPAGALAGLVPSWHPSAGVVQGLVSVAVFGLAVMMLPARVAHRGPRIGTVVVHVRDLDRAARFWTRALNYERRGGPHASPVLSPVNGDGPTLTLDSDDDAHLDLFVADEEARRAEVERLIGLGARRVDWPRVKHTVLADPEGNLFCVVVQNG